MAAFAWVLATSPEDKLRDGPRAIKLAQRYAYLLEKTDRQLGQILDALESSGERENTIVVFTTDHGHVYGHHGLVGKGAFHYDDLLRLPFIVSCPGQVPQGRPSVVQLTETVSFPSLTKPASWPLPFQPLSSTLAGQDLLAGSRQATSYAGLLRFGFRR